MHLECNFYHEINKFQLKYKPFPVSLLSLIIYQSQIEVLRSQAQGIDELDKKSVMIKLSDKGYQNADYINLNIVMDVQGGWKNFIKNDPEGRWSFSHVDEVFPTVLKFFRLRWSFFLGISKTFLVVNSSGTVVILDK